MSVVVLRVTNAELKVKVHFFKQLIFLISGKVRVWTDQKKKILKLYFSLLDCNSTFLKLTLITEGATEKVSQFILPLKSFYDKKPLVSVAKNVFLNATKKFEIMKKTC